MASPAGAQHWVTGGGVEDAADAVGAATADMERSIKAVPTSLNFFMINP